MPRLIKDPKPPISLVGTVSATIKEVELRIRPLPSPCVNLPIERSHALIFICRANETRTIALPIKIVFLRPLLSSGPEHRLPIASPNVALEVIRVWSVYVHVLCTSKML